MARTIDIPPIYYPGTLTPAPTRIAFELVDAEGQAIIGFTATEGYARSYAVVTDGTTKTIELPANEDIQPDSQWKITLSVGSIAEEILVVVTTGDPIDLRDLIHPVS